MKLTRMGRLSRQMAAHVLAMVLVFAGAAAAHEVRPAVADVTLEEDRIEIFVRLSAEALLSGIDLSAVDDTNDAPEAAEYDAIRALEPAEIETRLRENWEELRPGFRVEASGPITLELGEMQIGEVGDIELPRESGLVLEGALPEDGSPVRVGWIAEYGPLVVRQGDGDQAYSAFLRDGELSAPLPREGVATEGVGATIWRYLVLGFEHIVPKGLDHILFVLGLFFFSLHFRPLLLQVTAFTLAHTVTLALATLELVTVSPAIVEPLIAASITYVAIENILRPKLGWWRTAVVFGFGLLHGLGFASVLGEIGLDPTRFIVGLISFNIGVEIGQLAVILVAFLAILISLWAAARADLTTGEIAVRERDVMFRAVSIVGSLVIAIVGAWWFVERVFL